MSKITEFIKGLKKGNVVKIVVIMGIAGMVLILLSDLFSGSDSSDTPDISEEITSGNYNVYVLEMENRLETTLEKIDGVGNADVMLTVSGTEEYVYAQEEKTNTGSDSVSKENKYVVIGGSGQKEALLRKVENPEISGVVVVCEGGDSNIVKEKVLSAVSAVFDIPSQKIFVAKSK